MGSGLTCGYLEVAVAILIQGSFMSDQGLPAVDVGVAQAGVFNLINNPVCEVFNGGILVKLLRNYFADFYLLIFFSL